MTNSDCPECRGTGDCLDCEGTGRSEDNHDADGNCCACDGTGICMACDEEGSESEQCVWIFCEGLGIHLTVEQAERVRDALNAFIAEHEPSVIVTDNDGEIDL